LEPLTLAQVLEIELPAHPWAVERLLWSPGLNLLYGPVGGLKTFVALEFAFACAAGAPFLTPTFGVSDPRSVLFLELEMPDWAMARRLRDMQPDASLPVFFVFDPNLRLDDPATVRAIASRPEILVILDSLVRAHRGDENEARDAAALYREGLRPLVDAGKCLVLLHHARKSHPGAVPDPIELARASTDWVAQVDSAIYLRRGEDGRTCVTQTKSRYGELVEPFFVRLNRDDHLALRVRYLGTVAEDRTRGADARRDDRMAPVIEAFNGSEKLLAPEYLKAKLEGAGMSESAANHRITEARNARVIVKEGNRYRLGPRGNGELRSETAEQGEL